MKPPAIPIFIFAFAILLAQPQPLHAEAGFSYVIFLASANGTLSLNSYSLALGDAPDHKFQPDGGYNLAILDVSGRTLYSLNFSPNASVYREAPLDFFDENGTQVKFGNESPDVVPLLTTSARPPLLIVPYFSAARQIQIRDPGGKPLLSIDVSRYANADAAALARELSAPNDGEGASLWLTVLVLSLFLLAGLAAYHLVPKARKKARKKKITP